MPSEPTRRRRRTARRPATSRRDAERALCRAALYGAVALGFRPPTEDTLLRLADPQSALALADAARVLDAADANSHSGDLERFAGALGGFRADLESLRRQYRRLFGHTVRSEVPPYETEYGEEAVFQQPQELADIAGFITAFGLVLPPEAHERVDHISAECELLSFLSSKQAYLTVAGDRSDLEVTAEAIKVFLRDHLARFAYTFAHRLEQADGGGFYGVLGNLLRALVSYDCRRLDVSTGSGLLRLRPDPSAVASPMGCDPECAVECAGKEIPA